MPSNPSPTLARLFALSQRTELEAASTEVRAPVEAVITRATPPRAPLRIVHRISASDRDLLDKLAAHAATQRACCVCGVARGARGIRHVADCALALYVGRQANVIQPGEET